MVPGATPSDSFFEQGLEVLELDQQNRKLPFAAQLVWNAGPIQLDAIIHLLTKLRQSVKEEHATRAWELIFQFWDEQIDGDWTGKNP